MLSSQNLPVSNQHPQKLTPTLELELFAAKLFHSISPMDARMQAQEENIGTLEKHLAQLNKLVGYFLFEHKRQVDSLACLCNAQKYFAELHETGSLDFIDISMNLSAEAEIEFVGDTQSPEGKSAFQVLAGIDMMLSIYNARSVIGNFKRNKELSSHEIETLSREIFLIMRNLGLLVFVAKLTPRDTIDSEIAEVVFAERDRQNRKITEAREYDAERYSKAYDKSHAQRDSWFSRYLTPLVAGRRKGGTFSIKNELVPFLERLIEETGVYDMPTACEAIKRTCKETEPMRVGEMLFYWDDEPDTQTLRAAWLNSKKERKSEKIAIETLASYIREIIKKNKE